MKKIVLTFIVATIGLSYMAAQDTKEQHSLLWRVSGKDLKEPSYLFGTFHLLTHAFVDSMPEVLHAYNDCKAVVGELVIDSTLQSKMIAASMLEGTTLKQVLPDSTYRKTAAWLRTEAGIEMENLNVLNPMAVMTVVMAVAQQIYFPNPQGYEQLDTYFQSRAKKDGKTVLGLEDIDLQIEVLYKDISLTRQSELLNSLVNGEKTVQEQMKEMYMAYVTQNLDVLQAMMFTDTYNEKEINALLTERNNHWMTQLPKIFKEQPSFVAVGALHLTGSHGLVAMLRSQGYTVTPIKTTH